MAMPVGPNVVVAPGDSCGRWGGAPVVTINQGGQPILQQVGPGWVDYRLAGWPGSVPVRVPTTGCQCGNSLSVV